MMFTGICELDHAPFKDAITSVVITRQGFLAMYEEQALEKFALKGLEDTNIQQLKYVTCVCW